jgi:hypothetical protein
MTKTMTTEQPRTVSAAAVLFACLLVSAAGFASGKSAKDDDKKKENYGLIFGTAYGPDDRPLYGVRVIIHPAGKKHPSWELVSDHRGEFAQRVPPGPGDYEVSGAIDLVPVEDGKPQNSKRRHLKGEAKVHIDDQERRDFSLHLTE